MAFVYISEYADLPVSNGRGLNIAQEPPITEQTVANGGATTQSSAFNGSTHVIRVHTDTVCSISIGANPTATTSTKRLAANQTEYFYVTPGHKLAAILNT